MQWKPKDIHVNSELELEEEKNQKLNCVSGKGQEKKVAIYFILSEIIYSNTLLHLICKEVLTQPHHLGIREREVEMSAPSPERTDFYQPENQVAISITWTQPLKQQSSCFGPFNNCICLSIYYHCYQCSSIAF